MGVAVTRLGGSLTHCPSSTQSCSFASHRAARTPARRLPPSPAFRPRPRVCAAVLREAQSCSALWTRSLTRDEA